MLKNGLVLRLQAARVPGIETRGGYVEGARNRDKNRYGAVRDSIQSEPANEPHLRKMRQHGIAHKDQPEAGPVGGGQWGKSEERSRPREGDGDADCGDDEARRNQGGARSTFEEWDLGGTDNMNDQCLG